MPWHPNLLDQENGARILDGGLTNWRFLFRGADGSPGLSRAIRYALAIYLALFFFGPRAGHAANECLGIWPVTEPESTLSAAADAYGTYSFYCMTTIQSEVACGVPASSIGLRWTANEDGGTGNCGAAIRLQNTCETYGLTTDGNGECQTAPPDPCEDAYMDDFVVNESIANPGLCEVGDYEERTEELCQYSESANENCDVSIFESVQYVSEFPTNIAYVLNATYGNTTCDPVTNSSTWEFDPCTPPGPPPPTCPEGQVYNSVTAACEAPSDVDGEAAAPSTTATRDTTTVTTTSTVDNGDGTFTTTSTTTTTVGDCPPGETCTESIDYEGPGELETKTFKEALDAFWDDIQNAPILLAASNIEAAIPESPTCPTWTSDTIPIVDDTVVMDGHCIAIDGHEGTVQDLMLIVYSLIGLFILLSA